MRLLHVVTAIILASMLHGCGPTVQLYRLKPAELDMSSMRRLVVLDFDYHGGNIESVEDFLIGIFASSVGLHYGEDSQVREAASYATGSLLDGLSNTKYFVILDSTALRDAHLQGRPGVEEISRALGADAILIASLNNAECNIETFFKKKKAYDTIRNEKTWIEIPWEAQHCQLTIFYRVISTRGNILEISKRFTEYRDEEAEGRHHSSFHDPEFWYQDMIDVIIPQIVRQLAPYEVYETRRLKKDKTYDQAMERATALFKAGNLRQARDLFLQRWQATANPAAGYNAAILYEAEGDLISAINLLGEVIRISNDSSIIREHRLVLDAIEERRIAEEQLR